MRCISTILLLGFCIACSGQSDLLLGKKVNVHITFDVDGEGNITSLEAEAKGQIHHFNKK